jgi:hypothetical protein
MRAIRRGESLRDLAMHWAADVAKAPRDVAAGDLYAGRAIAEAKQVARAQHADLFVASAGLGLVHECDSAPNYNVTVGGDGALRRALAEVKETPDKWWTLLTRFVGGGRSLAGLVSSNPGRLVLLALPSSYLHLVRGDLETLADDALTRIRIFTSAVGRAELTPRLNDCALPYDDRLESLPGFDGTRSEFPQRALRHFVMALRGHALDLDTARKQVAASLAGLGARVVPARQRLTDKQISQMLMRKWNTYNGSSTRLLRYLRDEALVACEQGRFRQLWQQVRAERGAIANGR